MKILLIRVILLILALCLSVGVLASCGDNNKNTSEETKDNNEETTISKDDPLWEQTQYKPAKKDLNQYEFRELVQGTYTNFDSLPYYESENGLTGDAMSIALFERNTFIEEEFNITITVTQEAGPKTSEKIQNMMSADEDLWDVCFVIAGSAMPTNLPLGNFINLLPVEQLKLEASYWDQAIQKEYLINGKLFTLEGDYTIMDEMSSAAIYYSGKLYDDYGYNEKYGTPYELVESGKWTYETMLEMFKDTSYSANGTELTKDDRWGMIGEAHSVHQIFMGAGINTARSGEDGVELLFDDPTLFNKCYDILNNILKTLYVENDEFLYADASNGVLDTSSLVFFSQTAKMFTSNQALFYSGIILHVTGFRNMQTDFGILPVPKYEESQTNYYCWVSGSDHMPLVMPITVITHNHLETSATIMEAIAYYSRYANGGKASLYDSFYEKMAVAKICRTNEDYKMLELIYNSKIYDLDMACNFSRLMNVSVNIIEKRDLALGLNRDQIITVSYDTLRSNLVAVKSAAKQTLIDYLAAVEKNSIN